MKPLLRTRPRAGRFSARFLPHPVVSDAPGRLEPMSELRALLQTDVVDSTRLSQQLGDAAMAALWEQHDRVARDLLRQWRGREIDKSDGFLLLFDAAADAVGYALAYHRGLAGLNVPLKARAGLHVGPVHLRQNSGEDVAMGAKPIEIEGLAKPTVARIMSLAQGGQTLLTAEAKTALGATTARLQAHGHWRMKGIEEPIELFEVGEDGAPFTAPPDSGKVYRVVRRNELWLPMRAMRHSLPAERDPFIGRHAALQELARRFDDGARLISVLGIGGAGKSRLAQRFGWTWLGDYPGGVWFCDLSQARSLDGIVYAVAQGLDVPLGRTDPVVQLGAAIAGRGPCLVILDNFEQVSRFAEETLGQWLDRAGEARFVVTTREVLGIPGEEAFPLAPMATSEGGALFLRRAAAARPGFELTSEDEAAIDPLVKLLDGLPLAIELAAARVRVMPPRMLLRRMSERFKLLASAGGRRDRQATLRATFDWSWELLSMPERATLAQLSVFEVGFTLAAAEAVLDLDVFPDPPWPVDAVQSLVEKSLVRRVSDHRFDLLGSVQEYVREHLGAEGSFPASGPEASARAQARHWCYFATMNEQAAVADKCIETENLVAACRRCCVNGDARHAVLALMGAWAALRLRGPFRVAVQLAADVRAMPGLRPSELAAADWIAACALYTMGNAAESRARLDAGLSVARTASDWHGEARLRCSLGEQQSTEGHAEEALQNFTRALELAREFNDRPLQCRVLNGLGTLRMEMARLDEARTFYESALAIAKEIGDERWEGGLLGNLGMVHYAQGRLETACEHYERALILAQDAGDRQWEGNARSNLGLLRHEQGKPAEAKLQFEAALGMAREMGHPRLECVALCNLGIVVEAQGELSGARLHYEQAVAIAREMGDARSEGQFRGYLGWLYARLGEFAQSRGCLAVGEALLVEASDRLGLGLLLCHQAHAQHLAGDSVASQASRIRAEALADELGAMPESELGRAIRSTRQLVD